MSLGGLMALVSAASSAPSTAPRICSSGWIPRREYLRHVVGMLGVGVIIAALMHWRGHYYVEGVGYATILDVSAGAAHAAWFLVLLFALKLIATSLTLGSGASGGIFSPSLFMGATLGAACGLGAARALSRRRHPAGGVRARRHGRRSSPAPPARRSPPSS